jgi:predicted O-linked N-acetylglucosamine transferase (SPINDLY family)
VDLRPGWTAAWINLGSAAELAGSAEQACECCQKALALDPDNVQALLNFGMSQQSKGCFDAAMAAFEKVLSHDPQMAKALMLLGLCHEHLGRTEEAVAGYRRALAVRPDYAQAWYNLAGALVLLGRWEEVIASYERVVALEPANDAARFNLAVALRRRERIGEALIQCRQALAITPHFVEAKVYLFQLAQHACDWPLAEQLAPALDRLSATQLREGRKPVESPMLSLRRHADPEKNLAIAGAWSQSLAERVLQRPDRLCFTHRPRIGQPSIRVGYISRDFKDHAVAHHLLGLLRAHDRGRFSIYLYACNPEDSSDYRPKLVQACDHFVQIDRWSDTAAAQRIYDDRIDILVDLMGHTQGNRLEILAMRPAPVQVSYLGFLGTSGAAFIDYLITDAVVTPPAQAAFYTEKLVYLPDCYQVNDDQLPIAAAQDRRLFGLGDDQLVLCCFNQPYKIDRRTFEAWLAILKHTPRAVLWLLGQNQSARENLGRAAAQAGIASDRLKFAGALRIDQHLARLKAADLALDPFIYNGGATTANALWAGVPVLTLLGKHFVSRMSASALMAVGLPELIAPTSDAYVEKALDLLQNRSKLETLRVKLGAIKNRSALFDTRRFGIHMEAAFAKMMARFNAGKAPASFSIGSTEAF